MYFNILSIGYMQERFHEKIQCSTSSYYKAKINKLNVEIWFFFKLEFLALLAQLVSLTTNKRFGWQLNNICPNNILNKVLSILVLICNKQFIQPIMWPHGMHTTFASASQQITHWLTTPLDDMVPPSSIGMIANKSPWAFFELGVVTITRTITSVMLVWFFHVLKS